MQHVQTILNIVIHTLHIYMDWLRSRGELGWCIEDMENRVGGFCSKVKCIRGSPIYMECAC